MNIQGHAFTKDEEEIQAKRFARYKEIQHLRESMILEKAPQYGKTMFAGKLKSDKAKALSEEDIALIADHGNLCFGGICTKSGDTFTGCYYTD